MMALRSARRGRAPLTLESALADEGHPLHRVLDGLDTMCVVLGPDRVPLYANARCLDERKHLSGSADDRVAAITAALLGPVGHPSALPSAGTVRVGEAALRGHASAVLDGAGATIGYALIIENVSQRTSAATGASAAVVRCVDDVAMIGEQLASIAAQTSERAAAAASGTHQLRASVQDIARSSSTAATTVDEAVVAVRESLDSLKQLVAASNEIGGFLKLITSVAEQTKLLALNATIEAARAGDVGKGFAVVADEVKQLATATAASTADISRRIAAIQSGTRATEESLDRLDHLIARVSEMQVSVSAAIEEQAAVATEIAGSVTEIATGAQDATVRVGAIRDSADGMRQQFAAMHALVIEA